MDDNPDPFAVFYSELFDRWNAAGNRFAQFSSFEQETIALYCLNSEYGANGLSSYFNWHGDDANELILRGLDRTGAVELKRVFESLVALLKRQGFNFTHSLDEARESWPEETNNRIADLDQTAADLYDDFYRRWEAAFKSDSVS